ncbi:MAG: hypothetical protein GX672_09990 [Synergistaceae bacterium]|nr:hypothetical protein [Synergistaceae bacterium]
MILSLLLNGRALLWAEENQIVLSDDTVPTHEASQMVVSLDVQEDSSETFVLPDIYEISINMIYPGEGDKKNELSISIKKLLIEGRGKDAAQKIGEVLGRQRKNSKAYLGFYCKKALPSIAGGLNERAQFLSWFLVGYGKSGLVMVSKEGIEKLSASGRRRGEFWKLVEEGKIPSEKLERIYETDDAVYIPFSSGEIFILDIVGSDQGEAAVWKILPEGINRKTWSAGPWEREITIRGDRVN